MAEFLPPIEIPWKFAATTQPLAPFEPAGTAISLFYFEPDDKLLSAEFPEDRIIYLKFTTTVSPADFPTNIPLPPGFFLGERMPCFHMRLDLKVRRAGGGAGSTRPYFHAAGPMNRRMIQSGVVGTEFYEGEADAQFTGKSGSQMYESSSSRTKTTSMGASAGGSIGPVNLSGSARRTTTDVSSERSISQTIDTTSHQASEERRELISHHTKIENVLTLLNAKYVGTPHLGFSLWPQPLHLLALDPSDQNVWFSQLLQRRSSGIEGVQEFTAVLMVPRDTDFCVNARLRRVCVLTTPPGPFRFEPFSFQPHSVRILNYLDRVAPPGTPIEELDVDLMTLLVPPPPPNQPEPPNPFIRPIVEIWTLTPQTMRVVVATPRPTLVPAVLRKEVPYKHILETWLDTQRDEYERKVVRSPLEGGVVVGDHLFLDTCFSLAGPNGGLVVTGSSPTAAPMMRFDIRPESLDLGGVSADVRSVRADVRQQAYEAITRWNLLENRLATLLGNRGDVPGRRLRLDDADIVTMLIETWARLPQDDPGNLDFEAAMKILGLTRAHRGLLKTAGATDLRTIAAVIEAAPAIARYRQRLADAAPREAEETAATASDADVFRGAPSIKDADDMRRTIGAALQGTVPQEPEDV